MAKINLTKTEREAIKKNYDKLNPEKLKGDALRYYNLIKAGKKRYSTAFKNKEGKISYFSDRVMRDLVEPLAQKKGVSTYTFLHTKSLREEAQELLKRERLDWSFNEKTVKKLIQNMPDTVEIYIFCKTKKYKMKDKNQLREYIAVMQQRLKMIDRLLLYFKVSVVDGFSKIVFFLPDNAVLKRAIK